MSDSRVVTIRKSANLNLGSLRTPFLFLQEQFGYSIPSILRPLRSMPNVHLGTYPNTFPNTITDYYWVHEGQPGGSQWMALGKLTNGLYFLYTAVCGNTQKTFLDGGKMNLWVSLDYGDLIQFAMDSVTYTAYFNDTVV